MDLGEPFRLGFRIDPGEEGSFVVYVNERPHQNYMGVRLGFTSIDDLLIWMAKHGARARVTEDDDLLGIRRSMDDDLLGIRRTSAAAKTLAQRIADSDAKFEAERKAKQQTLLHGQDQLAQNVPSPNDAA